MNHEELEQYIWQYTEEEIRAKSYMESQTPETGRQLQDERQTFRKLDSDTYLFESSRFMEAGEKIVVSRQDRFRTVCPHKHDYIELCYVWEGECRQSIEGKEVITRKGDICIFDTQAVHSIEAAGAGDILINILMRKEVFDSAFLSRMTRMGIVSEFLADAVTRNRKKEHYLYFPSHRSERIRQIMEQILLEYFTADLGMEEILESYLIILFTELLRLLRDISIEKKSVSNDVQILELLAYIEEHYETCTLKYIDKSVDLSNNTINFNKTFYKTIHRRVFMLQQIMTKPGEIIFEEVPVPEVGADQVKVKIMNIGICGSDIHVYHGKHPFTSYPVTQGHEVSGEIVELGADVTGLSVGQKVTIEPQVTCGKCHPCRHGKYNLCEELKVMGFQTTGTASEYFVVDASKITPIPQEMSYEEGAMIEPLAVAVHGVKQMGDVSGMDIVVIGAGPIGNLVAQTAKGMGARKVMITDVSDLRLAKAKECGIDVCVNTREKDFGEAMVEAFGPNKADVIYDCAGNNITMGQAIKYARKGSVIVLVAVFASMTEIDLAVANDHELDIKSTMMYRHEDYVDAIRLVNEDKVHLRPLISKSFAFRDFKKAYEYIDANRETTMKVLINVQE